MDPQSIKAFFPIFKHQPELIWADNASTTQKPQTVIQAITDFYERENSNVHRGLYALSEQATIHFESVRTKVASFIGAENADCIAFTKGTTESINIVANSFLSNQLKQHDEVIVTAMEHHANLIPWQQLCLEKGAHLRVLPVDETGRLQTDKLEQLITRKTKLVAVTQLSNTLGTKVPVEHIIDIAHAKSVPVLVDAAQSISSMVINVAKLKADFLVFSAHKMFGPMGTGVLYCRQLYHHQIKPFLFGGGAIRSVEFENTDFLDYPRNLEPGTPHVAGVFGLGAAIDFMNTLNMMEVSIHVLSLARRLREGLKPIVGLRVLGPEENTSGIVSFYDELVHPHDLASYLATQNIAVRAGHHCTQPLLDAMGIPATVRVSFSVYNTNDDVDKIIDVVKQAKKYWA